MLKKNGRKTSCFEVECVLDHRNNMDQSPTVLTLDASSPPYVIHWKHDQGRHGTGDRQLSCNDLVDEMPSQPPDLVSIHSIDNLLIKCNECVSLPNSDLECAKDEVSLDKQFHIQMFMRICLIL